MVSIYECASMKLLHFTAPALQMEVATHLVGRQRGGLGEEWKCEKHISNLQ